MSNTRQFASWLKNHSIFTRTISHLLLGADVKGVADYLPADKLVPAWGGILACAPQLLGDGSSPRQIPADVLSVFGQQGLAECEFTKIQQYLQAAAAAAEGGADGQSSASDQVNRIIIDVTFPDVIPIAGQGMQGRSAPLAKYAGVHMHQVR